MINSHKRIERCEKIAFGRWRSFLILFVHDLGVTRLHVSLHGCILRMSHCCWAPQLDDSLSKKSSRRSRTAIAANLSKFGVTTPFNCQPSISISTVWVVSLINPNFPVRHIKISFLMAMLLGLWTMFPSLQPMFCSFNDSSWLSTSRTHSRIFTKTISRIPGQKSSKIRSLATPERTPEPPSQA